MPLKNSLVILAGDSRVTASAKIAPMIIACGTPILSAGTHALPTTSSVSGTNGASE